MLGGREGDSTSSTGDDPETCELSSRLEFAHQIAPVALLALRQGPHLPHLSPEAEKNAERIGNMAGVVGVCGVCGRVCVFMHVCVCVCVRV